MKIIVSNNLKIENPTLDVINYCHDKLILDNPDFIVAKRVGTYLGNIIPKIKLYTKSGNTYYLPFGCFNDIYNLDKNIKDYDIKISQFKGNKMVGNIKLYDYQEKACIALKSGKNGILEAPCGSGKTQIGLALINKIGGKALWLTHTKKLLEQSRARCEMYFKGEFGEITEGEVNIGRDITFATVQTMSKIDTSVYKDEFDIVIVDECHHCVGTPTKVMQFYKIVSNINCRYKYGLSATLNRADNLIDTMYSILGKKLYTIDKSVVGNKILKAIHRPVNIDINYNPFEYLDYDGTLNFNKLINMLSSNKERNNIIINNVIANKDKKQLILCHRVAQVEELSRILKDTFYNNNLSKSNNNNLSKSNDNINISSVTGKIQEKKRNFKDASIIVATYQLAKEGLDIPDLCVLHLATPQKNISTTQQAVGRIERNLEGKETPICYDYVDTQINYCVGCYKKRKRILKDN